MLDNPQILSGIPVIPHVYQVLCKIEVTLSWEPHSSSQASAAILKLHVRKRGDLENWRLASVGAWKQRTKDSTYI